MATQSTSSRTQDQDKSGSSNRGFAAMDPEQQREIASMGGKAAHASGHAHEFTPEEAREAGRKGGEASHGNRGGSGGENKGASARGQSDGDGNKSSGGQKGGQRDTAPFTHGCLLVVVGRTREARRPQVSPILSLANPRMREIGPRLRPPKTQRGTRGIDRPDPRSIVGPAGGVAGGRPVEPQSESGAQ